MTYTVLLQPALLIATALITTFYLIRGLRRKSWDPVKAAAVVALAGFTLSAALVVTPPGHRGVIYSQSGGVLEQERVEGLSFIVPYFQSAVQLNVRTQKWANTEVFAQTKDIQEVTLEVAVNYHVDPSKAAELYRDVGRGFADVLIRPAVFQLAKAEVGQVLVEDLPRRREAIAADIETVLRERLSPFGVEIEFLAIEDAFFQADYTAAVQRKVIADQKAEEERRLVAAEEAKKQQVIVQAEAAAADIRLRADAQAEANDVVAASLTADLLIWRRILQWNGQLPQTTLGGDTLDVIVDLP